MRVANEAEFILNRMRADDVLKHADFEVRIPVLHIFRPCGFPPSANTGKYLLRSNVCLSRSARKRFSTGGKRNECAII